MSGYGTEVAEINSAYSALSDVKADLDTSVNNLEGAMQEALATWKGAAAESFASLMTRVDEKGRALNNALQALADLLEQAGGTYTKLEEEGGAAFGGSSFGALD
jgi:WXG100 family type VII secretion target